MNDIIISVNDITKKYGSFTAVNGISFNVKRGEIFGILGPNGAGKTSLLEMMEGLRSITAGDALIDGLSVKHSVNKVKRIIGIQLQSTGFFEELNLIELLNLYAGLYDVKINPMELLHEVELEDKAKSQVRKLSGGQQQRFAICLSLANTPKVIFLDEPTTGLDPQARRHVWGIIKNIREKGMTIIFTTHYMEEAENLCDRVMIMDHGDVIKTGKPVELIENLISSGFKKEQPVLSANLEDVFISLTGHNIREDI